MTQAVFHKIICMLASRAVHSPVNGTTAIPWRRSRSRQTLLEQLKGCQEAWCPRTPWDREEAEAVLGGTPTGVRQKLIIDAYLKKC